MSHCHRSAVVATGRTVRLARLALVACGMAGTVFGAEPKGGATSNGQAPIAFERAEGSVHVILAGQPIAQYVFNDDIVRRPYFRHLRTLSGVQVTRNHPPVAGQDRDDHATMHPGLWLAFGDLSGTDFWRNKGLVRHRRFVSEPKGQAGSGSFAVENVYEASDRTICTEICRINIQVLAEGYLLDWRSTFASTEDFTFGDQEEMGLGVRVATPYAVVSGGEIVNSEGRRNEPQVWGRQADWCHYSGATDGRRVGVALFPHPQNFRRSWFHARDYGLLVANPFGTNAFTRGEKSQVTVKAGDEFTVRFGVLVFDAPSGQAVDVTRAYQEFLKN